MVSVVLVKGLAKMPVGGVEETERHGVDRAYGMRENQREVKIREDGYFKSEYRGF